MRTNSILKSVCILALAGLVNASSAQAAMGTCIVQVPMQPATEACPGAEQRQPACPLDGAPGVQGASCGLGNEQLGKAIGGMAAGGLQIAASVMRALIGEASKVLGPASDM